MRFYQAYLLCAVAVHICTSEALNKGVVFKKYDRKIDLTSQLVKVLHKITLENIGSSAIKFFIFSLSPAEKDKCSFIGAKDGNVRLAVSEAAISDHPGYGFHKVYLKDALSPGRTAHVEVESILSGAVTPYPSKISQGEKQLVVFEGNHFATAAYQVLSQTTLVSLPSSSIESYSRNKPTSQSDSTITYGPYEPTPAFSVDPLRVHYENNAPFLSITRLERLIEVSHWGNIAVEETIDILHTGAKLRGPFSRFDYQRDHNDLSVVKSLLTVLPASASDVYYRDEIGNISTSELKVRDDSVELKLRPRFPLFGGWKTHYKIGYNVPSYEYLLYKGDQYALKMRFLDHVFEDMVVDEMTLKIVLPEGVTDVQLDTPYPVSRAADTLHPTYLDTSGRIVVTATANNLSPRHIQDFLLAYKFSTFHMLQEPMLVVAVFLGLLIMVMVWVRVDLRLSADPAQEAVLLASSLVSQLCHHHGKRADLARAMLQETARHSPPQPNNPKQAAQLASTCSKLQTSQKEEAKAMTDLLSRIRACDQTALTDTVSDLVKHDRELEEAVNAQVTNLGKLLRGNMTKQAFADADAALVKTRNAASAKCRALLAHL